MLFTKKKDTKIKVLTLRHLYHTYQTKKILQKHQKHIIEKNIVLFETKSV